MGEGRYTSVSEMIAASVDDSEFVNDFEEQLKSRKVIKALQSIRVAKGKTQNDVAQELGCTQARISKMESGFDGDLRLRDIEGYLRLLDLNLTMMFVERGCTLADQVKHHAIQMNRALRELVHLAQKDDALVKGVASFWTEAFLNTLRMLQESADAIPNRPDNGQPYVNLISRVEDAADDCEEAAQRHKLRLSEHHEPDSTGEVAMGV